MERGLSRRIAELREQLVTLEAYLAHHIDFPEEDEAPVPVDRVVAAAAALREALEELLETAPEGELLREGALTVLAGPPNSGKSSLYNALLGEERAIVTEVPGTTRDALEAVISVGGFPFRLVDTAGLHDSHDRVEGLGIEVARRYLDRADVVLFCVESDSAIASAEREFLAGLADVPTVLLRTKADLVSGDGASEDPASGDSASEDVKGAHVRESVELSVVDGTGLGRLRALLPEMVYGGLVRTGVSVPALTRARQSEAVRKARDQVVAFMEALEAGTPVAVASALLRPAETALEELLGLISTDEIPGSGIPRVLRWQVVNAPTGRGWTVYDRFRVGVAAAGFFESVDGFRASASVGGHTVERGISACGVPSGNRPDGTVEVHAAGDPETLEAFATALELGPPMARVDGVDGFRSDGNLPTHFEII